MYAIIKIRGSINTAPKVKTTFDLLNLTRSNHLSIWPEDSSRLKMLKKVEGYATFGVINDDVLKELLEKKGNFIEGSDAKKAFAALKEGKTPKEAGIKNCFRMNPPRKGYERKGVKKPYTLGGALGFRGEKINDLILKMM